MHGARSIGNRVPVPADPRPNGRAAGIATSLNAVVARRSPKCYPLLNVARVEQTEPFSNGGSDGSIRKDTEY